MFCLFVHFISTQRSSRFIKLLKVISRRKVRNCFIFLSNKRQRHIWLFQQELTKMIKDNLIAGILRILKGSFGSYEGPLLKKCKKTLLQTSN